MIKIRVTGSEHARRKLKKLAKTAPDAVAYAMMRFGEILMDASIDRTPVATGELRDSAYVSPPMRRGFFQIVELGYGADYAPEVHERTEKSLRSGEPKFLQKAVMTEARGQLGQLAVWAAAYIKRNASAPPRGRYPARPKGGS